MARSSVGRQSYDGDEVWVGEEMMVGGRGRGYIWSKEQPV